MPHIYREPRLIGALLFNFSTGVVSLYAASLLDTNTHSLSFAVIAILVLSFSSLVGVLSGYMTNWLCLQEEIIVRKALYEKQVVEASRANVDLPIAIGAIAFYIRAPSSIVLMAVYMLYVGLHSAFALLLVMTCALVMYYPIKYYYAWRSRMIVRIRNSRNQLIDHHGVEGGGYRHIILTYGKDCFEYMNRYMQASLIFTLISGVVLVGCVYLAQGPRVLSTLIALLLLVNSGRALVSSINLYQEDRKSMSRVIDDLR